MIQIVSSSRYKINRPFIRNISSELLRQGGFNESHQVNIAFVGKNKMKQISNEYKQENVALPILSFPYKEEVDGKQLIGEIVICYPQVIVLAAQKNKKVNDMMTQLLKHGIDNLLR